MVGDEIRHARHEIKKLPGNETPENIEQKQTSQSRCLTQTALWLAANVETLRGNPLLELMARFKLSIHDAVDASKRAHALRFAGGRGRARVSSERHPKGSFEGSGAYQRSRAPTAEGCFKPHKHHQDYRQDVAQLD